MKVNIFDKEINIKDYYCKLNECDYLYSITEPYINLYIQLKGCNASCKFCEYMNLANNFNFEKFNYILNYLSKNIKVNKISITGGEPTLNTNKLYSIIDSIKKYQSDSFLVMNTNGYNLKQLNNDNKIKFFDSISLSRHHYNEYKNNLIFNTNTISNDDLKLIINNNKDIFHFSCNLIKNYIDSPEEIFNYLYYCNEMNIYDVGFVGLMKINDYCKSHFIDFNLASLLKNKLFDKSLFLTQSRNNFDECKCFNYLFLPKKDLIKPIKIYSRCVIKQKSENSSNLVFDGEFLRVGFGGKIII